jgi:hypothetical protein
MSIAGTRSWHPAHPFAAPRARWRSENVRTAKRPSALMAFQPGRMGGWENGIFRSQDRDRRKTGSPRDRGATRRGSPPSSGPSNLATECPRANRRRQVPTPGPNPRSQPASPGQGDSSAASPGITMSAPVTMRWATPRCGVAQDATVSYQRPKKPTPGRGVIALKTWYFSRSRRVDDKGRWYQELFA